METAEETKTAFEKYLKEEDFDEKLTVVFEQAEIDMNSADTYEEVRSVYRRYVTSLKDLIAGRMVQFTARQIARKICDDLEVCSNEKAKAQAILKNDRGGGSGFAGFDSEIPNCKTSKRIDKSD